VTFLMERSISRHKAAFSIGLLAICSAGAAWAQQSRAGSPSGDPNTNFLMRLHESGAASKAMSSLATNGKDI
jgi:hypothetical protein